MSKKKQSSDEEIWSKRFDEDQDELEYVSRTERSKNNKNRDDKMSPMLTGTVIFLAVLILATIFYYVWYSNRPVNQPDVAEEPEIEIVADEETEEEPEEEDSVDEEEVASEEEVEEDAETQTEPEPEPESETAQQPEPEPEVEQEPESVPEPEPESEPETETATPPATGSETYIVQPGDNMYRIALNHGMTTQELMALNNLTEETVFVGQELVVE